MKGSNRSTASRERLARILLKPGAWRHRLIIRAVELALRPLVRLFKIPPVNGQEIRRVLIFDPGALGDMVLLAPFLQGLRAHLPTSHITVAGGIGAGSLLFEQDLIDEWIQLRIPWGQRVSKPGKFGLRSWSWLQFLRSVFALRRQRFDLAFAAGWSGDLRGNLVIWLSGARQRVGYGYAGGENLLTDVVEPDLARPHILDRNMQLLEYLGVSIHSDGEILEVRPQDEEFAAELMTHYGVAREDLVVGIHSGAGSLVREWGDERFAEVARAIVEKFGAKILWFSDPTKPKPIPANLNAISLSLPLKQFAAVVSRCQLFLCNDSGPMHVASALKLPVVAVFGPQRPEWFGPYGEGHRVVIRNDVWCRPCGDRCRWKEPYCLSLIPVEQVLREVQNVLQTMPNRTSRAAV